MSVSGNVNGGNGVFTTIVSAASHTGTIVSVTGNVNGGNLISAALVQGATVSSSGNVVTVGVAASGNISATANVQGGNGVFTTIVSAASHTGTIVSVTGNVTGGNLATAGNVAVGAATAAYRLVVTGAANTIAAQVLPQGALPDNNDNAGLYVVHQGTAGTAFRARTDNALTGTIFAHVLVNNTSASINGFQVSQYGTGYIADFNKSGTALNSVRIDNNGNLGVGTTSVSYRLTLKQSTGDLQLAMQGTAKNWNFRNQADGTFGYFDDSLGYWRYYYDTSNNHIWFNSTSTERMRIDSGGTLSVVGAVSAGGNITGGNIAATSHTGSVVSITGNVTAAGATFGSGNVSTTGNIAAGFFVGNGSALTGIAASTPTSVVNGTTNFTLAPSGNANLTIAGTSNVAVFTTTGASFTGNITSNVANAYISKGLLLNATVVNVSYTLETGYNGQWVGPITINTGVVVTVPDGQRLLIA